MFKPEVGQTFHNRSMGVWQITVISGGIAWVKCIKQPEGTAVQFQGEMSFCHVDHQGFTSDLDPDWEVHKWPSPSNGMNCKKCREHFPMAEPNQPDGTLVCWSCREYPFYN